MKEETNPLIENTWKIEFEEWLDELRKRRLEFSNGYNKDKPRKLDHFYDLSDRCWGDVNGRLCFQYFDLLDELAISNPLLYEKYKEKAVKVFSFFSFYWITRDGYIKATKGINV